MYKEYLKKFLKFVFTIIPRGAPKLIYIFLLKPKPLRKITNSLLKLLIPHSITFQEGILYLNEKDVVVSGALSLGVYEKFEIATFRQSLKSGMTVLDIGAHIGYYSIIAAYHVGDSGRVFSFEPEPENFVSLQRNISANNFRNIQSFQYAISNRNGNENFYIAQENKASHTFAKNDTAEDCIQVATITVDNFCKSKNIRNVDIIKMDIEGAEGLALEGMKDTLRHNPHICMFTEFYPEMLQKIGYKPIDFLASLVGLGFSIFEINNETERLEEVDNLEKFMRKMVYSKWTNLYCKKS